MGQLMSLAIGSWCLGCYTLK